MGNTLSNSTLFRPTEPSYDDELKNLIYIPELMNIDVNKFWNDKTYEIFNKEENIKELHNKKFPALFLYYSKDLKSKHTIMYFHSNSCDLGQIYDELNHLHEHLHANILAIEYVGFGLCYLEGSTNQYNINRRALAAYNFLKSLNIKNENILLFGRSIGTGVASKLAYNLKLIGVSLAGIILHSPYISIEKLVEDYFTYSSYFIENIYDNYKNLSFLSNNDDSDIPLLLIHGKEDEIIHVSHSEYLMKNLNNKFKQASYPTDSYHNYYYVIDDLGIPIKIFLQTLSKSKNAKCVDINIPKAYFYRELIYYRINGFDETFKRLNEDEKNKKTNDKKTTKEESPKESSKDIFKDICSIDKLTKKKDSKKKDKKDKNTNITCTNIINNNSSNDATIKNVTNNNTTNKEQEYTDQSTQKNNNTCSEKGDSIYSTIKNKYIKNTHENNFKKNYTSSKKHYHKNDEEKKNSNIKENNIMHKKDENKFSKQKESDIKKNKNIEKYNIEENVNKKSKETKNTKNTKNTKTSKGYTNILNKNHDKDIINEEKKKKKKNMNNINKVTLSSSKKNFNDHYENNLFDKWDGKIYCTKNKKEIEESDEQNEFKTNVEQNIYSCESNQRNKKGTNDDNKKNIYIKECNIYDINSINNNKKKQEIFDNDNINTFKRNLSSGNLDKDKNYTLYNEKYKDEHPKHVYEENKKFPIINYKINDFKYYIKNNIINKEKIDNIVEVVINNLNEKK
ncbi:alpha/beta hydrolase, putative [Plasmodium sp. gorilla clade G2]|uniref:alpha/beta hydrolase, putative n=1 Tax=Plasmodium sp. gorilla clade G2 TaxID=880535 RepID=UPI000D22A7B8|nr:alpha/beta hydrolase, putative [Plasmodium sp. gorilla clade G2]SOV13236.1 alpha/beta hydrolase, putative [Plasmodium sp. gorilla clade G2]